MKVLAVFAALLAVACANNSWSLHQLSNAISNPHTDEALKPFLIAALNNMMESIWAGNQVEAVSVTIPSPGGPSMSLHEISTAIQNPDTDPALLPALEAALNQLMEAIFTGQEVTTAIVSAPAMEIHHYTLHDVSLALQDPTTNPQLMHYLEHALEVMMSAAFEEESMDFIVIAVPAGLNPIQTPIAVLPPVEVGVPVAPVVPEVVPATPVSPLVQIIVNVN